MSEANLKWYERAAAVIREQHDGPVFGLAGDANMKLTVSMIVDQKMRYVSARHENGAVSMAVGYAKASGKTGVCSVTQGPGVTNALTAMTAAARGRCPLVMLAGAAPTTRPDHPQQLDQTPVFRSLGIGVVEMTSSSSPEQIMTDAFRRAREEKGPIAISMPSDWQDTPAAASSTPSAPAAKIYKDATLLPSPEAIARAADLLVGARRPIIVAGRGAMWAGAHKEILALAEALGAVVANTLPTYGMFSGHPQYMGVIGGYAMAETTAVVAQADCILSFGATLGYRTAKYGRSFSPDAQIIHCDKDARAIGALTPATLGIVGDAKETARLLLEAVAPRLFKPRDFAVGTISTLAAARTREPESQGNGLLHPVSLMQALDRKLPRERSVVVDGGHCSGFPPVYMAVPDDEGFYFSLQFGSIGLGLGAAIGAALARPERLSVLVIGDGALLMSLPDIESAARQKIPLLVVVVNDHAYGAERHLLNLYGMPYQQVSQFDNPRFDDVARSLGGKGYRVLGQADLDNLPAWLEKIDGPVVLDCIVDPEVCGEWIRTALHR